LFDGSREGEYICDPQTSGSAPSVGLDVLPGLNGEPMFVWKADVDLCRVPESRTFFDSLVSDFKRHTRRVKSEMSKVSKN
jgi:hypothetical protein